MDASDKRGYVHHHETYEDENGFTNNLSLNGTVRTSTSSWADEVEDEDVKGMVRSRDETSTSTVQVWLRIGNHILSVIFDVCFC